MKRVVVVSDLHCGSQVGLTPPEYQYKDRKIDTSKKNKFAMVQRAIWGWYAGKIKSLGKIDLMVCNGDAIDGKGDRSGGTEEMELDRRVQAEMAIECLQIAKAKKYVLTAGTPYHVGKDEDHEAAIAHDLGGKFGSHEWIDVEGVILDCKHKISGSQVPHGRYTAAARDMLWNELWAARGLTPNAHIVIRSHVHYHVFCGDTRKLGLITPAMQGFGTKYGSRECSGLVDVGLIEILCDKGRYDWHAHIADIPCHKTEAWKV